MKHFFECIWRFLASVLWPHCCPACGMPVEEGTLICDTCIASFPRTEQAVMRQNMTEELFHGKVAHFVRGAAFLYFDRQAPVQNVLHQAKYHHHPEYAYLLATEAARDMMQSDFFDGIDVLVPVPLHPNRLRERGYNQSEWIARGLSDITGIPVDTSHVFRVRDNAQQALQSQRKREANVRDAFWVQRPEQLYRRHILLIDDVVTTGATLRSCLRAMRSIRGARFSVFALGKAR